MKNTIIIIAIILFIGCKKDKQPKKVRIETTRVSQIEIKETAKSDTKSSFQFSTVKFYYEFIIEDVKKMNIIARCDSGTNLIVKIDGEVRYNKYNTFHNYIYK
jgi:hypothetical protein